MEKKRKHSQGTPGNKRIASRDAIRSYHATPESDQDLITLTEHWKCSKSEAIRRALAIYANDINKLQEKDNDPLRAY